MGTTLTPNLGLIKPDEDESIREDLPTFAGWTAHNENNTGIIDDIFRHTTDTWAPTWTTDVATNPTLGTGGFVEGKFLRHWPRMVFGYIRIFTGTASFTPGTGLYRISLPVAVAPEFASMSPVNVVPIGRCYFHDNDSVANSAIGVTLYDIPNNCITFRPSTGDYWRHNVPFTLAVNDRVSAYFMYPTAVA